MAAPSQNKGDMANYKISTEFNGGEWTATLDGYDGWPNTTGPLGLTGTADTEIDAIVDLLTEIEDPQDGPTQCPDCGSNFDGGVDAGTVCPVCHRGMVQRRAA